MSIQQLSAAEAAVDPGGRAAAGPRAAPLLVVFTASVFLSAFLLFLVQPLFGKMVLPLLGGSPSVWNTCMLFFQAALLGGYLYAHLSGRLALRAQAGLHLLLLAGAAFALPISIAGAAPAGDASPTGWLLLLMLTTVGAPFLVLSGTGPLLQRWFSLSGHRDAADPYWLYAASNLGSLLSLLTYPFLFEPGLRLAQQSALWSAGYGVLLALIAGCAAAVGSARAAPVPVAAEGAPADAEPLSARERAVWVALAFVPSSLLLGVTTYITTDLTPVPLLWVLPLALYLLTFTLAFARRQILPHAGMLEIQPALLVGVLLILVVGLTYEIWFALPVHLAAFFVTAMVCHGELARRRPHARHLTEFYLWISVGGVLGGVFNVLLAPLLFARTWEYPLVVVLACLARPWPREPLSWRTHAAAAARAAAFVFALYLLTRWHEGGLSPRIYVPVGLVVLGLVSLTMRRLPLWLAACLGAFFVARSVETLRDENTLLAARSFYGQYRVTRVIDGGLFHVLHHGSTLHGAQNMAPEQRDVPLTYYVGNGPLGNVFAARQASGRLEKVAVVGLGTGTTAAYGRAGEEWTIYEIDPGIARIAWDPRFFTYLRDSSARLRVVLGDARLSLAAAAEHDYDLIVLDAFSSDAIPVHLLTREALGIYLDHLAPGGVIAFHVSNRYLELERVVSALAHDRGLAARVGSGPATRTGRYDMLSTWVVVARTEADLGALAERPWRPTRHARAPLWTDDHSSILSVFKE